MKKSFRSLEQRQAIGSKSPYARGAQLLGFHFTSQGLGRAIIAQRSGVGKGEGDPATVAGSTQLDAAVALATCLNRNANRHYMFNGTRFLFDVGGQVEKAFTLPRQNGNGAQLSPAAHQDNHEGNVHVGSAPMPGSVGDSAFIPVALRNGTGSWDGNVPRGQFAHRARYGNDAGRGGGTAASWRHPSSNPQFVQIEVPGGAVVALGPSTQARSATAAGSRHFGEFHIAPGTVAPLRSTSGAFFFLLQLAANVRPKLLHNDS
jgi:hypothetical protein